MLWVPEWTSTPGARRVFTCQVEPGRLQVGHNGNHAPLKYCQARERGSELVCLKFLWQHILMSVACCFMPYPSQNLVCLGKGGLKLHHKFRLNQFKHTFGKIKEYTYVFKNLQIPIICAVGENIERIRWVSFLLCTRQIFGRLDWYLGKKRKELTYIEIKVVLKILTQSAFLIKLRVNKSKRFTVL